MKRIFFDMDGTLAKFFDHENCLEKMYERGYFLGLKPYELVKVVKTLIKQGQHEIYILSACIKSNFCNNEKIAWVNKQLPEIADDHIILVPEGTNKAQAVQPLMQAGDTMILVDDYSRNLYEWEMMGRDWISIKFCNGLNNKTEKPYSYKVKTNKQLLDLLK